MIFDVPPGRLRIDQTGRIVAATAGDHRYLSGGGVGEVIIGGRARQPELTRIAGDADEVDLELDAGDGLEISVRHTVAAGWGWRIRLANATQQELAVDQVRLDLAVGEQMIGHPIAAGAEAELVIRPGDGGGPILAGRLTTGAIAEITDAGLLTGPLRLPAGAGFVITWQWTWYADAARLLERRRGVVPWPTVRTVGEPIDLRSDPDAALIVPDDLIGVDGTLPGPAGQITELVADRAARFPIEERSARGTVRFSLGWAPAAEWVIAERIQHFPAPAPAGPAGTTADGILLHRALSAGTAADPDDAAELLELIVGALLDDGPATGLDATLLCIEHHRTGSRDLLEVAVDWLLRCDRIDPGLGFAVTQACLARVIRGQAIAPIIQHAGTLAAAVPGRPDLPLDGRGIAELELLAAIHRTLEQPSPAFRARLRAAGPYLGSGEVAPARPALAATDQAALIAVVRFAEEQAAAAVGRDWAAPPSVLAEAAAGILLDEVAETASTETLAWLALAQL
ncbi:hypothetical protein GCM10028864_54890 [Microlunatus parietis]